MAVKNKPDSKIIELLHELKISSLDEVDGLFRNVKMFIQDVLSTEMNDHLGYEKSDKNSRDKSTNYQNGYSKKLLNQVMVN